jgi:hypothetical protein
MKQFSTVILISLFFYACGKKESIAIPREFNSVEIEMLLQDSLLNVRALEIGEKGLASFATSNGMMGSASEKGAEMLPFQFKYDSIIPNFRALAKTKNAIFVLGIGSPTLLYKDFRLVYKEDHEKAFYDSMAFWNDDEGIAIGDSTEGCISVIITRDGGETWHKTQCENLPKGLENEGAFAASNTNIAIVDNHTWVVTTAGRVYYSDDKGISWEVFDTPIMKEKDTEGIYSVDFYDENNGFAVGGDYTKPGDSSANKIRTKDGGKTWRLVAENKSPGYRSCVQYVPGSKGMALVAIGFKGIDYSNDSGNSWKHLSDEGFYTLRFLNDSIAYAAGNGRVSKLTFKQ